MRVHIDDEVSPVPGTGLPVIVTVILAQVLGLVPHTSVTRAYYNTYRYSSESYSHSHTDTGPRSCPVNICHTCLLQYLLIPGTVLTVIVTIILNNEINEIKQRLNHELFYFVSAFSVYSNTYLSQVQVWQLQSYWHWSLVWPRGTVLTDIVTIILALVFSLALYTFHTCLIQYLLVPGTVLTVILTLVPGLASSTSVT